MTRADPGGGLHGPLGSEDLHVVGRWAARVLHREDRAVADEFGIQLVRHPIAAELLVKIPQHFGLGESKRAIRRVRNGPAENFGQPEELFESARQHLEAGVGPGCCLRGAWDGDEDHAPLGQRPHTRRTPGLPASTRSCASVLGVACGLSTVSTTRTWASMPCRSMSKRW